jgi:hypothetical protein
MAVEAAAMSLKQGVKGGNALKAAIKGGHLF